MKALVVFGALMLALTVRSDDACRYMQSPTPPSRYEMGGPYTLDHFRLTKGRTDLRHFLWSHWHDQRKGVAKARVATVDRGIVQVLYVVQPDEQGHWSIDVELDRPMGPPCASFRADSLVRVPIAKPEEDYPSQTIGLGPPDKVPDNRLGDSDTTDSKFYRIVLLRNGKAIGDTI